MTVIAISAVTMSSFLHLLNSLSCPLTERDPNILTTRSIVKNARAPKKNSVYFLI